MYRVAQQPRPINLNNNPHDKRIKRSRIRIRTSGSKAHFVVNQVALTKEFKKIGSGTFGSVVTLREYNELRGSDNQNYLCIKIIGSREKHLKSIKVQKEVRLQREAYQLGIAVFLHDYRIINNIAFLLMDEMLGTLQDIINSSQKYPSHKEKHQGLTKSLALFNAVTHLHKHGIVHRDIKPSNILYNQDGKLLLADFGLSHTKNDILEKSAPEIGTLMYMPHNGIISNENPDKEALWQKAMIGDIYSLVLTIYQINTAKNSSELPLSYKKERMSKLVSGQEKISNQEYNSKTQEMTDCLLVTGITAEYALSIKDFFDRFNPHNNSPLNYSALSKINLSIHAQKAYQYTRALQDEHDLELIKSTKIHQNILKKLQTHKTDTLDKRDISQKLVELLSKYKFLNENGRLNQESSLSLITQTINLLNTLDYYSSSKLKFKKFCAKLVVTHFKEVLRIDNYLFSDIRALYKLPN